MKTNTYNLKYVVLISVCDKELTSLVEYKPFKKSFWGNTEEGFYPVSYLSNRPYTKEEIESGKLHNIKMIIEDNKVYYRPKVVIEFVNGKTVSESFNTYLDACKYGKEMLDRSTNSEFRLAKVILEDK